MVRPYLLHHSYAPVTWIAWVASSLGNGEAPGDELTRGRLGMGSSGGGAGGG